MKDRHNQPSLQDRIRISYYAILYMDVLNQREKLSLIDELPSTPAEEESFLDLLRDTYGVVDGFAQLFEAALLMNRDNLRIDIPNAYRQQLDQILGPPIERFLFSDSMLYYMPLDEHQGAIPTIRLHDLMAATANVFVGSLSDGSPARGGLEIGIAANFPRIGIYGPGLYKAYALESNVAQYPRVVIGSTIREYLIASSEDRRETATSVLRRKYAIECMNLIYEDTDQVPALDYAGEGIRKTYPSLGRFIIKAMDFANSELKRFQSDGNYKLINRYTLLRNYLSDRIQRFWQ